eukprot:TRINITY_DN7192_c0_g1_i2.p1 TRINITY_DN7192_c0_g1~~TRINITY_DN7192_c0_g1_i2.p1  ORF type:complete len:498 (-),score=110.25 TRINITY_DN7192_c0_g1_i2:45-1409(-)
MDKAAAEFVPAVSKKAAKNQARAVTQAPAAALVKPTAASAGGVLSTSAPPGSFFTPPQVQMPQPQQQQVQVPRRFPGHFMPHRLCNHWNAHGWCRKAESCTFAHGLQELHPDVQAQLLQQQPGMPPPTVTKDGRLVVPGAKAAGKVAAGPVVPEVASAPSAPMLSFPPPAAANPYTAALAAQRAGAAASGYPYGFGVPGSGFEYNVSAHEFNAGAKPFVPHPQGAVVPGAALSGTAPASSETQAEDEEDEDSEGNRASSSSPGKRRPAPAPLTLLDDNSPANAVGQKVLMASASPTTVGTRVSTIRTQPLASPMRISVVTRPLPSPTSVMSPTASGVYTASGVALNALSSPSAVQVPAGLPSPIRVAARPMLSPTSASAWPGSPTLMLSPKVLQSPKTPVPIDRSTFLQARQIAVKMEQGPPGLAMWAPTPTTKAGLLGFRYPAPGYVSVQMRQ